MIKKQEKKHRLYTESCQQVKMEYPQKYGSINNKSDISIKRKFHDNKASS
jgi:hypothetical protein